MRFERAQAEIAERVSHTCIVSPIRLSAFAARMADLEVKSEMRNARLRDVLSPRPVIRAD